MKFSIVIANNNSGTFLEECLKSVFAQECNDYEIIIVDAGSTDESKNTILKYKNRFAWWCSEKDAGQSDAFNKGFSRARGDYFLWLNADDLLMPMALMKASRYLTMHPKCLWLTFNTIFIDNKKKILFVYCGPHWNNLLMKKVGPQVDAPTSIFHRDLLKKSKGFDLDLYYAMDVDLWLQYMNLGYKYKRLPCFFYAFRIHAGSKTASEVYTKKTKNQEKIRQGKLIQKKNSFYPNSNWILANKIFKLFTCKIYSFLYNIKYKGKQL